MAEQTDSTLRAAMQEVAVHASSLWDGFVFRRDSDDLFSIWGQGGIELHFRMADLAMTDAQLCDALFAASDASFPGVYSYEVTEALGQMVANHLISTGDFPTEPEWQMALGELALEFFAHGEFNPQEMVVLQGVVACQLQHWQSPPADSSTNDVPFIPTHSPPSVGTYQTAA